MMIFPDDKIRVRAKISRVLKTVNPDFEQIELSQGTNKYIKENIEPKFDPDEYKLLKEIGISLSDKMRNLENH
jgi:hypothetical protein